MRSWKELKLGQKKNWKKKKKIANGNEGQEKQRLGPSLSTDL
jgi:hypothetical protein